MSPICRLLESERYSAIQPTDRRKMNVQDQLYCNAPSTVPQVFLHHRMSKDQPVLEDLQSRLQIFLTYFGFTH
ncbi:hypothetical protein ILYODFUR_033051 [Ilyodon furcidens]|uniref:Uncharacterized protein n=1 Tax=Ilyodon furcidens TaxID=33524 RepID=A0ABV0TRS5_9TELE